MSRIRNWMFTCFDVTYDPKTFDPTPTFVVWQLEEAPTTKRLHLQGYVELGTSVRLATLAKKNPGLHLEPRRGTPDQAYAYCTKTESRKDGPWEHGTMKAQGARTDLHTFAERVRDEKMTMRDIAEEFPQMVVKYSHGCQRLVDLTQEQYVPGHLRGIWIHGPPGAGKTRLVFETFPDAYRKAQNKWFDGYSGQRVIVLDDLDTTLLGHHLKIWADRYPCTGEVKGGTVQLQHDWFIITSNYDIRYIADGQPSLKEALSRRFHQIYLDGQNDQKGTFMKILYPPQEKTSDAILQEKGSTDLDHSEADEVLS